MILGVAFLLSSLLMYLELIQPAYSESQQIKAQKNSLQIFFNGEKKVVEQVQKLASSYEGQGKVQQAVSEVLPTKRDIAGAIAQIYGLAQNNGLTIKSLGMSVTAAPRRKNAAVDSGASQLSDFATSLQKGVGAISFDMQSGGSYENLKDFLSAIETNVRIFDVGQISVQPVEAAVSASKAGKASVPQDLLNYSFTFRTYYQSQ